MKLKSAGPRGSHPEGERDIQNDAYRETDTQETYPSAEHKSRDMNASSSVHLCNVQ